MNRSESINELATALAKAQAEMKNPAFDSTNPHFRSKYASLSSVRNAVLPILAKHGLALVQPLSSNDSGVVCETVLMHSSGQWISEAMTWPVDKKSAQGLASASTYARRIGMQSFVAVVGDEDDDGNEATAAAPAPAPARKPAPKPPKSAKPDADGVIAEDDLSMLPTAEEREAFKKIVSDAVMSVSTEPDLRAVATELWKAHTHEWQRKIVEAAHADRKAWLSDEDITNQIPE